MRVRGLWAAAAIPALLACGGDGGGGPADLDEPGELQIAIAGGDRQSAPVMTSLPEMLVVRVTDGVAAVKDVPVQWDVIDGSGQLSLKNLGRTDGQGLAAAVFFLGEEPGEQVVRAALDNGAEALFTAQATGPEPPPR